MTTLPPNYLKLSSKWLIDNPLPEDARYYNVLFRSWESTKWAGYLLDHVLNQGYIYATARTDLPKEAYADDEIRPMTHEERKALDEFTMAELRSEPGAEVASERAEEKPVSFPELRSQCNRFVNGLCSTRACLTRGGWKPNPEGSYDLATCEAYEAVTQIATLRAQLEAKDAEIERLEKAGRSLGKDFVDVRDQRNKLRAEVEELKNKLDDIGCALLGAEMPRVDQPGLLKLAQSVALERTRLTAELDAIVNQLARRTALDGFATTGEKISALLKIASAYDPKAELAKSLAELDAVRRERDRLRRSFDALGIDFHQQADELDASQARCGELERALLSAIQSLERYGPTVAEGHICGLESQCDGLCMDVAHFANFIDRLRALLTPSQQPDKEHAGGATKVDRPWSEYPIGTKAPAITGGAWTRVPQGWKWGRVDDGGGNIFPTPGGDNTGYVFLPITDKEPVKAGECPTCGALEVEANHPRTFYACGSSDYDQRPGTFLQSVSCAPPIAPEGKATEGEG